MAIFGPKDKKPVREADDLGPGRQKRLGDYPEEGAPIRRKVDNDIERNESWQGEQPESWPTPRWSMRGTADKATRSRWEQRDYGFKQDIRALKDDAKSIARKVSSRAQTPYTTLKYGSQDARFKLEKYKAHKLQEEDASLERKYKKALVERARQPSRRTVVVQQQRDPVAQARYDADVIRQTRQNYFLDQESSPLSDIMSSNKITSFWDVTRRPQSQDVRVGSRVSARAEARNTNRITINVNGRKVKVDQPEQQPMRQPESMWGSFGPDINVFSSRQQPSMPARQAARLTQAARKYPSQNGKGGLFVGHLKIF